jgi:hypothetical protein
MVLLIALAGVGFFAFADDTDLTIHVKITDGIAVPQLQVYSMGDSGSHGSRTFTSAEVFDGAQLLYDRRTSETQYSIIRITDKLPNCTFPTSGSAEIPLEMTLVTIELSEGGAKCKFVESTPGLPIEGPGSPTEPEPPEPPPVPAPELTTNLFVRGLTGNVAQFYVFPYDEDQDSLGEPLDYKVTQDHWATEDQQRNPQVELDTMHADYKYAVIKADVEGAFYETCYFNNGSPFVDLSTVDVVVDLSSSNAKCALENNFQPGDLPKLLINFFLHGVTDEKPVIFNAQHHNSSGVTENQYAYSMSGWPVASAQETLVSDYEHSNITLSIAGGSPITCRYESDNSSTISKATVDVVVNLKENDACVLYDENPHPKPIDYELKMDVTARGIDSSGFGASTFLYVYEYKSDGGVLPANYAITRDYYTPWTHTQEMSDEYNAYTQMAMLVNNLAYPCYFADDLTEQKIEKSLPQIYVDFEINREPAGTPACLLSKEPFPMVEAPLEPNRPIITPPEPPQPPEPPTPNTFDLKVNIGGFAFNEVWGDRPTLAWTQWDSETRRVVFAGVRQYDCSSGRCLCMDGSYPDAEGFCRNDKIGLNENADYLTFVWFRYHGADEDFVVCVLPDTDGNTTFVDVNLGGIKVYGKDNGYSTQCVLEK